MRDCDAVADNMAAYQNLYSAMEGSFDGCELNYISRANNTEADELANIGSTRGPVPPGVFLESISQRSIKRKAAADGAVRIALSLLDGYPKWKVRCSVAV